MIDSGQSVHLTQGVRQEQLLTPQQLQSLEFLASPLQELQQKIARELEFNPVVELADSAPEDSLPEKDAPPAGDDPGKEGEDTDAELARIVELTASGAAEPSEFAEPPSESGRDEYLDYLFDSIPVQESMQQQLMDQLSFSGLKGDVYRAAVEIIGSIDETGYLKTHPADIATATGCSMETVEEALRTVQSFDPPGIGARTLAECLLLQLDRNSPDAPKLAEMIENHLDDAAKNRLPKIAGDMNLPLPEVERLLAEIRKLNPAPGGELSRSGAPYIEPEVVVEAAGDEFKVVSNTSALPELRISKRYLKMLEDPNTPDDAKAYIKAKLLNGNSLIRALEQRENTIARIARIIVSEQYEFLTRGVEYLKPMTMRQIADKLNLHETTVSRAVSGKYMLTPAGLFEFRFFFSGGFRAETGEEVSARGVKSIIEELVDDENPASPLSDNTLAGELKKRGLNVARRTVAKYREELGIPSSQLRKKY